MFFFCLFSETEMPENSFKFNMKRFEMWIYAAAIPPIMS